MSVSPSKTDLRPAPEHHVQELLWSHTLSNWERTESHEALLAHATSPELLRGLAQRYRLLTEDATRAEIAKKQLARLAVVAMTHLVHEPQPSRPSFWRFWLVGLFVIGSLLMLILL